MGENVPLMNRWVLPVILIAIGAFFLFMTYGALITSHKKGVHISGVPCMGGLFIFLGFILSPVKWLSVLILADPGYYMIAYMLWTGYTKAGRAHEQKKKEMLLDSLSPELKNFLDQQKALGNTVRSVMKGRLLGDTEDHIYVILNKDFLGEIQENIPGIEYTRSDDRHSWKSQFYDRANRQKIVHDYEVRNAE